jgi:hypothetical protein
MQQTGGPGLLDPDAGRRVNRPASLRRTGLAVAGLLAVHALLLGYAAIANSATFDEYAHLPAGCAYWRSGDFSIYNLSPPLLRMWAAVPALLAGADVPDVQAVAALAPGARHWEYGEQFLRANFDRYESLVRAARWGMIPISCLGAWLVFAWARELSGTAAGLAACALYVLNPDICAHASLVTTDAGTAVAMLAALWLWQRFCQRPTAGSAVAAGAVIGAAHLCKFTALLLWPALVLIAAIHVARHGRTVVRPLLAGLAGAAALTLLMVNAVYGFRGSGEALRAFAFQSRTMQTVQRAAGWLPVPLPREYLSGFDVQKFEAEGRYTAYLLGEQYDGSRWYYYPVALAIKLPLGTLGLIAVALVGALAVRHRGATPVDSRSDGEWAVLAAIVVFGVGMVVLGQINIGVRYLLPMYPLAFILISRLWSPSDATERGVRRYVPWAATALLVLGVVEFMTVYPRGLTFINGAAGGPAAGGRLLNDSNFDWGQALVDLRRWMRENRVSRIHLGYFGSVDPGAYGISYTPLIETSDLPHVAVSSFYLAGLKHRMPTPRGRSPLVGVPFHAELWRRRPLAVVGSTIFIYSREDYLAAVRESRSQRRPATRP